SASSASPERKYACRYTRCEYRAKMVASAPGSPARALATRRASSDASRAAHVACPASAGRKIVIVLTYRRATHRSATGIFRTEPLVGATALFPGKPCPLRQRYAAIFQFERRTGRD